MRLRNGTFLTLLLFCLCAFLSLSWYAALSGQKGKRDPRPTGPARTWRTWASAAGAGPAVAAGGGRKPTQAPLPRPGGAEDAPPTLPHLFAAGAAASSSGPGCACPPSAGRARGCPGPDSAGAAELGTRGGLGTDPRSQRSRNASHSHLGRTWAGVRDTGARAPLGGDVVDVYQREFLALRDRLHAAEQESLKRSKELNLVLDEIKRAVSERQALRDGDGNRTWGRLTEDPRLKPWNGSHRHVLHLPTVFHHLPHLLAKESSLQPAVRVGQGRTGVSVVMGIPSVRREVHSYLTDTLHSLISELSPQEKEDSVIVVLIAETDSQYTSAVTENIKALFPTEIHSGLLEVISPSPHFYPDFSRLRESFGDPKERVRWRTKQNLDYCFLMMYAQSKGIYYVQLEDDIVAKPNYLSTMKNFALQQPSEDWMILEFSQLGFIGKMFKSLDLSLIVEFILMFYRDKPIDWLLDHILWVKVCNPEKDAKHCDRQKANLRIRFKPSLFQHVGTHSSLAGKIQKLKDKDFGKQALRKEHVNPPAEVSTSLKTYQHFTLEKAYLREDFFWAFTPAAGDFIRFRFFQPLRLERFFFRSGNIEHPEDKLFNTSVEVLPFDNPQSDKEALQEGRTATLRYPRSPDGYLQIGSFYKGVAEGEVDPAFGPLEALRLSIQTDSPVWVILSEIFLKKAD
ncbi:alpha-1,3-mannosyl-glycoprotein 4-beta-N-acetylglucosaminyltransferase B isoform X1 [Macaca mulatta]